MQLFLDAERRCPAPTSKLSRRDGHTATELLPCRDVDERLVLRDVADLAEAGVAPAKHVPSLALQRDGEAPVLGSGYLGESSLGNWSFQLVVLVLAPALNRAASCENCAAMHRAAGHLSHCLAPSVQRLLVALPGDLVRPADGSAIRGLQAAHHAGPHRYLHKLHLGGLYHHARAWIPAHGVPCCLVDRAAQQLVAGNLSNWVRPERRCQALSGIVHALERTTRECV
mmetsp:Transcript_10304/g.26169  ORF Transcript_10304/g.26169 Transcript_10304/m.26169 type:complete len:227 (+) Transcript_10304:475-1155(+)